jgi:hypothetical protein
VWNSRINYLKWNLAWGISSIIILNFLTGEYWWELNMYGLKYHKTKFNMALAIKHCNVIYIFSVKKWDTVFTFGSSSINFHYTSHISMALMFRDISVQMQWVISTLKCICTLTKGNKRHNHSNLQTMTY